MEAVVPWTRLAALIDPYYTKPRKGRPQMPLSVMLRLYFLQQWYSLSAPGAEEALYDMHSMRNFAGLDLAHDAIPDETTILNFRHLLEAHNLAEALFDAVSGYLQDRSLPMRGGTIMDATLIAAAPPTKNKARKSGLVHTVKTTTGKVHDAKMTNDLIRADDTIILGDKRKRATRARGTTWAVKDKRKLGRILSSSQKRRNKRYGVVRAKVEHVFRVIKCQFGYCRVRYRGLFKNTAQMFSLMALANL